MDQVAKANSGHLPPTCHLPDISVLRHLESLKRHTFRLVYAARNFLYDL
jgi:hypothetical protein